MYSADHPIRLAEGDLLGRRSFAKHMGNLIANMTFDENFVIGINGPWGSGKTSLINMIYEEVNNLLELTEKKERMTIVNFNPWHFSSKEQLYSHFFRILAKELRMNGKGSAAANIGNLLDNYGSIFTLTTIASLVGPLGPFLSLVAKGTSQLLKRFASNHQDDLEGARSKIAERLRRENYKIVVVIDDIDRLPNEQISQIMQLVKSVAGFPRMVYILSYDKEIVSNALKSIHNMDGKDYLEKIIQLDISLPITDINTLQQILNHRLEEILMQNVQTLDAKEYRDVCWKYIMPLMKNLRDVYRLLNIFNFRYSVLMNEVNPIDLLLLCLIDMLSPNTYKWIASNRIDLVESISSLGFSDEKKKQEYSRKMNEQFEKMEPIYSSQIFEMVCFLFPLLGKRANKLESNQKESVAFRERRICHPEMFHLYFTMDIDSLKLTHAGLEELVFKSKQSIFLGKVKEISLIGQSYAFMQYLDASVEKMDEMRIIEVFPAFLRASKFLDKESPQFLITSPFRYSFITMIKMLSRIENENVRYELLSNQLADIEFENLTPYIYISFDIAQAYGYWDSEKKHEENQVITIEHFNQLVSIFHKKILEYSEEKSFIDDDYFSHYIAAWEKMDASQTNAYILDMIKDTKLALLFVIRNMGIWRSLGEEGNTYDFSSERIVRYIDDEKKKDILEYCSNKNNLSQFPESMRIKILAYKKSIETNMAKIDSDDIVVNY